MRRRRIARAENHTRLVGAATKVDIRQPNPSGADRAEATARNAIGERESGTEAVKGGRGLSRGALKEQTRDRNPLAWATTQNNLGGRSGVSGRTRMQTFA